MADVQNEQFDVEAYIQQSLKGLELATEAHKATWGLGREGRWNANQDTGELSLHFEDGTVATADMQIIGTLNTEDGTFLWGWEHPSVDPELQRNAALVREFGQKHGIKEMTTQKISCTEERAWELTALAMRLASANGAFRAVAAHGTHVFINFGEVQLEKDPPLFSAFR